MRNYYVPLVAGISVFLLFVLLGFVLFPDEGNCDGPVCYEKQKTLNCDQFYQHEDGKRYCKNS